MSRNKKLATVQIGPEDFRAHCEVPRDGIGFWERCRLTITGRIDARHNGEVVDFHPTHTVQRLLAHHRHKETQAVRVIDEVLSRVDRALAQVNAQATQAPPETHAEPSVAALDGMTDADRSEWVHTVKSARAAQARAASVAAQRTAALTQLAELESIRESITIEGDDVRQRWAEAFNIRAAHYTRARFHTRHNRNTATPDIPHYVPAPSPTPIRRQVSS